MFTHVMLGTNNVEKAKAFYDALFKVLGGDEGIVDPKGRVMYIHDGSFFLLSKPIDGKPATVANGGTIGFKASSTDQIDEWHKVGVANGGAPIEDPPGWREMPGMKMYLAYMRDPDGNKICAMIAG